MHEKENTTCRRHLPSIST